MSFEPGARLEPYEIVAPLGAGGMGEVYRARDPRLGREVAIKVLPPDFVDNLDRLRRFEAEARTISSLNHPNVLTIYDVGSREGAPFLVFELLDGRTLREMLGQGPLPRSKALDLGAQLCRGLAAAHQVGVVHRDLKPENLFVTDDGRLKILDFGLAKALDRHDTGAVGTDDEETLAADGTEVGAILGTVGYMSPEQVRGEEIDERADIFAAGAVLHEMFSGQRAFQAPTRPEILTAILRSDPSQPISDPVLDRIVRRCLEKQPEERFHSAGDVAFALEAMSDTGSRMDSTSPVEAGDARSPRYRAWPVVAVALLVALLTWSYLSRPKEGTSPSATRPGISTAATEYPPSVVVLPLTNLSGDNAQEYFADGMTEALITDLARLSGLRVISRTSAMRYKGSDKTLAQIADELDVEYALAGTALQIGEQVRISVELVEIASDQPLWAERYERDLSDVLKLQSDVSSAIARATQLELTPEEQRRLQTDQSVDPRVHELYLRGRYLWHTRDPDSLRESLTLFERAVELDRQYAPGHLGVALASLVLSAHTVDRSAADWYREAGAAAERALSLDPELAEGHLILAEIALHRNRDWARAESKYRRALELNPGDGTARYWATEILVARGQFEEALRQIDLALKIDPLSPVANLYRALILFNLGREEESLRQFEHAADITDFYAVPSQMGLSLAVVGRCPEALEAGTLGAELSPQSPKVVPALAYTKARCGDTEGALRLLAPLEEPGAIGHEEYTDRAFAFAAIGNLDRAFELLEEAIENNDSALYVAVNDFRSAPLRQDSRFASFANDLDLPIVPLAARATL